MPQSSSSSFRVVKAVHLPGADMSAKKAQELILQTKNLAHKPLPTCCFDLHKALFSSVIPCTWHFVMQSSPLLALDNPPLLYTCILFLFFYSIGSEDITCCIPRWSIHIDNTILFFVWPWDFFASYALVSIGNQALLLHLLDLLFKSRNINHSSPPLLLLLRRVVLNDLGVTVVHAEFGAPLSRLAINLLRLIQHKIRTYHNFHQQGLYPYKFVGTLFLLRQHLGIDVLVWPTCLLLLESSQHTFLHRIVISSVRRRTSEAHIQRYQPGSFGPPIVTTGPPLQEQWINSGTKKKFVYSNADVIWRSNERRVRWGGSRERIFADIAQNEPRTNGRNARNLDIVRGRRHNMAQRSSLRDEGEEEEEENIFNRHHSLQRRPSNPRDPTRIPSAPSLRPIPLPGTSLSTTDMNVFMSPTRNHQSIPFEIHPELRIKYPHEPQPRVHWDILRPPYTTAVQYYLQASPNVIPLDVYSSAANPPLHRIKITIDSPEVKFWMRQWDMIHVNRNVSEPYITVGDVLQAIYEYFHTGLTQDDLASIPFAWRRVLEKARTKRLRSEQMEPGILGGGGEFVRADLLNGNTLFAGLRSNQGSHMWELILSGQTSWYHHGFDSMNEISTFFRPSTFIVTMYIRFYELLPVPTARSQIFTQYAWCRNTTARASNQR